MAIADTSDGFYSLRSSFADDEIGETKFATRRLIARWFRESVLLKRYDGAEWIDTKLRSFDTDTRE